MGQERWDEVLVASHVVKDVSGGGEGRGGGGEERGEVERRNYYISRWV